MKRIGIVLLLSLILGPVSFAQQDAEDAPASKADIERYLDTVNGREMMRLRLEAADKQVREIIHNAVKAQPNLPPDFEPYLINMLDDMMKDVSEDKLIQAAIPVYQKHLTKAEVNALIAFYSTPQGKKILKEMPTMQAEVVQASGAILQPAMTRAVSRVQEEITRAQKEYGSPSKKQTQQN
jgi:hypothetical protein